MKVLLVEPFGHWAGYTSTYSKYLSCALANAGVDVTLVTFDGFLGSWTKEDEVIRHVSFLSKLGTFALPLRFLQRFKRFAILGLFITVLDTFLTFLLALQQSRKRGCDVVHIANAALSPLSTLALACFTKNYNLVLNLHGASREFQREILSKKAKESLRKYNLLLYACFSLWLGWSRLASAMEDFCYRRSATKNRLSLVCYTEQINESYRHRAIYDRVEVIPLAVAEAQQPLPQHQARQYLNLPQEGKFFLLFGINDNWKNYEVLFQAVQKLSQDVRILRAGKTVSNEDRNNPYRLAEKYGWSKKTIIVDQYIPEEEMIYYFSAADALILSYTNEFLGQSVNLLHGCQFALPVIASDVGELGECVKAYELGLTFAPEDAQSLRGAIALFLNLSDEGKLAIKRNLHEFASAHSWEQYGRRYLDIYKVLLEE